MRRISAVVLVGLGLALSAFGCSGGGLSQDEATMRCEQLKSREGCVVAKAYDACVACYEECGDRCKPVATCPTQFACPAE